MNSQYQLKLVHFGFCAISLPTNCEKEGVLIVMQGNIRLNPNVENGSGVYNRPTES